MAHDPVNASALPQPYFRRTATHTLSVSTASPVTSAVTVTDVDVDVDAHARAHAHHPHPPNPTTTNNDPASLRHSNSSLTRTRCVRLHLAARDVPEPDARSHTSYAVLYYAREVPVADDDRDDDIDVGVDLRHTSAVTSSTVDRFQLPFDDGPGGPGAEALNGVLLHGDENNGDDEEEAVDGSGQIRTLNNRAAAAAASASPTGNQTHNQNATTAPVRRSRQPFAFLTKQRSVPSWGRKTHPSTATSSRHQSYNHPPRQQHHDNTQIDDNRPSHNHRARSTPQHQQQQQQQQQRRPQLSSPSSPSSPSPSFPSSPPPAAAASPTSPTSHDPPLSPLHMASALLGPRYRDRFVPSVGKEHQHSQDSHPQPQPYHHRNNNTPQPASPNAALNRHATDGYARSRPSTSTRNSGASNNSGNRRPQGNILTPFFKLDPHARTLGRAPEHALPRVASPDRTEVVEHPAPASPLPRRSVGARGETTGVGGGKGIAGRRRDGRRTVSAGASGTIKTGVSRTAAMASTTTTTIRSRIQPTSPSPSQSPTSPPQSVKYVRSGWTRIGTTELARKHGRDVEFARTVTLQFRVCDRVVVRACMFDGAGRRRLIGTADFSVSAAYAADGKRIFSPLSFVAVNKADKRKKKKTPHGKLVVVAQRLPRADPLGVVNAEAPKSQQHHRQSAGGNTQGGGGEFVHHRQGVSTKATTKANTTAVTPMTKKEEKFRLDVECGRILRATALSVSMVKRVFYTIHAVLDRKDELSDSWTLLFRSDSVEMIHTKRDGGSMQKNYFSGVRLRAMPAGDGFDHHRPISASSPLSRHRQQQQLARADNGNENENATDAVQQQRPAPSPTSSPKAAHVNDNIRDDDDGGGGGLFAMVGKMLGVSRPKLFFSLPGADLLLLRDDTRLKLSVWEDNGVSAGYDLVADTLFTMADLKKRELGESSAIKVHANVVGKAILKYVECSPDPHYFCLSLRMQNIQ